jgi:hypothetical protein
MFEQEPWWSFLEPTQQELLRQSYILLDWAKKNTHLQDYSFLVMPAAKAYEGYLKKLLYSQRLIDEETYTKDRFRLGKALNPELESRFPQECLYNELSRKTTPMMAEKIWDTWKRCRNRLLHYFPAEKQAFTLKESEERLDQICDTIRESYNCFI